MHTQETTTGENCPKSASHDNQRAETAMLDINKVQRESIRWLILLTLNNAKPIGCSEKLILTVVHADYPDATQKEIRRELGYLENLKLVETNYSESWQLIHPTGREHAERPNVIYPERLEKITTELKAVLGDMPHFDKNKALVKDAYFYLLTAVSNINSELMDSLKARMECAL